MHHFRGWGGGGGRKQEGACVCVCVCVCVRQGCVCVCACVCARMCWQRGLCIIHWAWHLTADWSIAHRVHNRSDQTLPYFFFLNHSTVLLFSALVLLKECLVQFTTAYAALKVWHSSCVCVLEHTPACQPLCMCVHTCVCMCVCARTCTFVHTCIRTIKWVREQERDRKCASVGRVCVHSACKRVTERGNIIEGHVTVTSCSLNALDCILAPSGLTNRSVTDMHQWSSIRWSQLHLPI